MAATATSPHFSQTRWSAPDAITLVALASISLTLQWLCIGRLSAPLGPLRNFATTLVLTLPYVTLLYRLSNRQSVPRIGWILIFLTAAALRINMPWQTVLDSVDAYRYLWDGMVLDRGINPYIHSPQAAALAPLQSNWLYPNLFRPELRTIYPPLAELWFWCAYRISPDSFFGLKLVLFLHELATLALLIFAAKRRVSAYPLRVLVYAWSPLAVVQLFSDGHLDGLLLPWLLVAVQLTDRRPLACGVTLALATLTRPIAVLCAPTLVLRRRDRSSLRVAAGFLFTVVIGYLPFLRAGSALFETLLIYGEHWQFNSILFRFLSTAVSYDLQRWARWGVYTVIAAISLSAPWLTSNRTNGCLLVFASYFALTPTLYSWYLLPVLCLATFRRSLLLPSLPALLGLSDLVLVSAQFDASWQVPPVALVTEFLLICALLIYDLRGNFFASRWTANKLPTESDQ